MHCRVGLATFVKVAPIWERFDAGTQSSSIMGTPVSLICPAAEPCADHYLRRPQPHNRAGSRKPIPDAPNVPACGARTGGRNRRAGSDSLTCDSISARAAVP